MSSLNIRKDVDDKFYRYKMPSLQSKIEGKGNGIKTVIPNMADIARALNRPSAWPTKFFGIELGAQVICDDKTNRYIVNGAHEASRLQELLYLFINKYVLCGNCHNPETDLILDDASMINSICKACGEKRLLDNRHKLAAFIQKAVPTLKVFKAGQHATAGTLSNVDNDDSSGSQFNLATSFDSQLNLYDESILARDNTDMVKHDVEEDPYEQFGHYLSLNPDATSDEIRDMIDKFGIKEHYAFAVLVQVAFENISDEKLFMEILTRNISIWRTFSIDKKCQKNIIGGIERTLHNFDTTDPIFKKIPIYLQKLYNEDILEEEAIIEWSLKPPKTFVSDKEKSKALRTHAIPFIDWLKMADEASSSE